MADNAVLNWRVFSDNKPFLDTEFIISGDGQSGEIPDMPTEVQLALKSSPIKRITALAYDKARNRLVAGTGTGSVRFWYSDDLGSSWKPSNPVSGFIGFADRAFFVEALGEFFMLSAPGSSHRFLHSIDGITWTTRFPVNAGETVHNFGYAYSPELGFLVVGNTDVVLRYDGTTFGFSADPDRLSMVWDSARNRYVGVQSETGNIYISNDATTWDPFGVMPGGVAGTHFVHVTQSGRIIVFCVDTFARYSDDGGQTWTVASGDVQTSGSVTRYVAVDSNTLYVAYRAELNLAAVSLDGGTTWEQSAHRSGYATAIVAIK